MAALIKKLSIGFLVMLLVTLIAQSSFADSDKELDLGSIFEAELRGTEFEDFKVGMPLYRVKGKPGILIPASKLESSAHKLAELP
ncbi:hypothetical protein I3842_01G279200 [Carya illinoinensis]|uniref:Uncharacterized protein n=1 Tax=Carya illinoinensis TaxID=32201 RepID=A0A922GEA8_CARIL|nr:hypothetical protein I3842_01G279200 [Carya illinoinensis]